MKLKHNGSIDDEKDKKEENIQAWTPPSLDCRR